MLQEFALDVPSSASSLRERSRGVSSLTPVSYSDLSSDGLGQPAVTLSFERAEKVEQPAAQLDRI